MYLKQEDVVSQVHMYEVVWTFWSQCYLTI